MNHRPGRHFLQLPGPSNVPDRILRAMDRPTIDHRGREFAEMTQDILGRLHDLFDNTGPTFIYPASATGAWEAALVNTLSPGDRVLAFDHGFFASQWQQVAARVGLTVDLVPGDWHRGVSPTTVEEQLRADAAHRYRAVLVVHNETSTGVTARVGDIRQAMNNTGHPALLMVDAVSSLGSIEYHHDAWGVDVTVTGSQKGLMLPPGLSFNAVSAKAMEAHGSARLPRSYWDWTRMLEFNTQGFFPYTPATNLLFGLHEALKMLEAEGFDRVFRRHRTLAEATRAAVRGWSLDIFCDRPDEHSNTVTAVTMPDGSDADAFRTLVLDRYDMSLGGGLGPLKGKVFRIGHLGDLNALMLCGTLCGIEMGLGAVDVRFTPGGVQAAMEQLGRTGT